MEKFICSKNGKTYQIEEKNGKRFFFSESGVALQGFELNVVRNWYEKEHGDFSEVEKQTSIGENLGWKIMKRNDFIYAKSHADFLNQLFGLELKGWMKSSREYNNQIVWMVYFDEINRGGWCNHFLSEDECCQFNAEHRGNWDGKDINESLDQNRVVFEIKDAGSLRKYVFRGVFEYEAEKSNALRYVYFKKISDEFKYFKRK